MKLWCALAALALASSFGARASAETLVLQNDSFATDGEVAFQDGFVAGEEGAAVLGPLEVPFTLQKIRFLFGTSGTETVELVLYEDDGSSGPGKLLFSSPYEVTASEDAMYEIDISANDIEIDPGASVRVSLRFAHAGLPSIARDADGASAGRNWIYTVDETWVDAGAVVGGDWIIRAVVETDGGGGPSATASSATGLSCSPADTRTCTHISGCTGVETCTSDGLAWGACVCKDGGEGGAGGGAATPADSGGCSVGPRRGDAPAEDAGAWLLTACAAALARRWRSTSRPLISLPRLGRGPRAAGGGAS